LSIDHENNTMKKIINILAVAAILLVSCAKETQPQSQPEPQPEPTPVGPKVAMTFGASVSDCVKTVLTDGTKTYWKGEESISIFDGTSNKEFTTTLTEASPSATFKGSAAQTETYYALYPYNDKAQLQEITVEEGDPKVEIIKKVITTTIPSSQTAVANSYDPDAALLACKTADNTLTFSPAVALLKFQLGVENVTSVDVYANDGRGMAGDVNLTFNNDNSDFSVSLGTACHVILNANSGTLSTNTDYYLAVCPYGNYWGGLSIILKNSSGQTITKVYRNQLVLSAGTIYYMGTINGSWEGETTTKIFTDSMQKEWTYSETDKDGGIISKASICNEAAYSGTNGIKWVVDQNWWKSINLKFIPPSTGKDLSSYKAIRFKMKFAKKTGSYVYGGNTVFQNRVSDAADDKYFHNVYAPADNSWRTITLPFQDFVGIPTDFWKNSFTNFNFHTTGWFPGTAEIYFDDIELINK